MPTDDARVPSSTIPLRCPKSAQLSAHRRFRHRLEVLQALLEIAAEHLVLVHEQADRRATKLFCPNMAHVTAVRSPSGLNVNSAVLVPAIGCAKSSLILMSSAGRLWVSVMRPSPISLLPAQAKTAP